MIHKIFILPWIMSLLALSQSTVPLLTPHGLNATALHLPLLNSTISNSSSLTPYGFMRIASEGDSDSPPDRSGFTDPDVTPPSTTPAVPTSTVIITLTPSAEDSATTTGQLSVSTEYLSQVPKRWPYTKFGVGRKKETVTWGLTDGAGQTVGVVKHDVCWYPRPLTGGEMLEGWRPTFVVGEGEGVTATGVWPSRTMSGVLAPVETMREGADE